MAVPPIVIKAIATAATDKRTWEFIAMLIAAVPVILCVMSVAILVTGAESSSVSLLEYSFNSEELPSGVSEEQRQAVENMRFWLVELDEEITEYPDSGSLDENLVKAVFYCVNIGGEAVVTQPYADFLFHPIRLLFRRSSGIGRLSEHPRPQPGCHAASRPPCRRPCRFPKCLSKCAAVRSSGAISPSALGFLPIPPPHAPVCPLRHTFH